MGLGGPLPFLERLESRDGARDTTADSVIERALLALKSGRFLITHSSEQFLTIFAIWKTATQKNLKCMFVRESTARQVRGSPADTHHPLTLELFERFEADIEQVAGGNVTEIRQGLLDEERVMRRIPLSSQHGEGVHRQSRLVKIRSPSSGMPWVLATARVEQNIAWVKTWVENENPDAAAAFDFEWVNAKRIAQHRRGKRAFRPVWNKWSTVCDWVYRLKQWGRIDWSPLRVGRPAAMAAHDGEPGTIVDQRCAQAELLQQMLKQGSYYSLPLENQEEPLIFQVARISSAPLKVLRGIQYPGPPKTLGLHLVVQMLRVRSRSSAEGRVTVFAEGDAEHIDLIELAPWSLLEKCLSKWTVVKISDVYGCVDLAGQASAQPNIDVMDKKCPVLLIARRLQRLGWQPKGAEITHTPDAALEFSTLKWSSRRPYLQCLLRLDEFWEKGVISLSSEQPVGFWLLLLRGQIVAPKLGAAAYRKMLLDGEDEQRQDGLPPLEGLEDAEVLPQLQDGTAVGSSDGDSSDEVMEAVGGHDDERSDTSDAPASASTTSSSSSSSSSSASASSNSSASSSASKSREVEVEEVSGCPFPLPTHLEGCRLRYDDRMETLGYRRLIVFCSKHSKCTSSRNISERHSRTLGQYEPLAYLAVWAQLGAGVLNKEEHHEPALYREISIERQRQWLQDNGYL